MISINKLEKIKMSSRNKNFLSFFKFNQLNNKLYRNYYLPVNSFLQDPIVHAPEEKWPDIAKRKEAPENVLALPPSQEKESVSVQSQVEVEEDVTKRREPTAEEEDPVNDYVFMDVESVYIDEDFEQILKDITLYEE